MDTKIWFLFTIVAIVQSRDLFEGSQNGGIKIFDENKKANPAIWRQMENITITAEEGAKIDRILVTDLREEKDGDARIVEGGIGQQNVTIELKSPTALRGYDFHIEVYKNTENGHASAGLEDGFKQKTNPEKSSKEETTIKESTSAPISLSKQETSSPTPGQNHEESINGKSGGMRQNRDVEDKEKVNKQLDHTQLLTDITTEVPELKSTGDPTINNDKRDDRNNPLKNNIPEHVIANQPRIQLQETHKMPESTARSILSTEFKTPEEKHHQQRSHDNFDEDNKHTKFDMNEKHANINYSQFNVREVTPNVPVVNAHAPGQKRHTRDVNHNTPVVESTEHPLPSDTFRNQGQVHSTDNKVSNGPAQKHRANPTEANLRHFDNSQNKGQVRIDKAEEKTTLHEDHNHNNAFKGRYIPDRFARNPANSGSANSETSTEINKISTATIASSISPNNLNVNSAQLSTPNVPKIIINDPTTNKPETVTDKQMKPDINSELHINTKKSNTPEQMRAHKRVTRDAAYKNNKEQPSELSTDNLKNPPASPTTFKPEITGQSELDINGSKIKNSHNLKTPIEISSEKENANKHDTAKSVNVETKDKQRNIRGSEENKDIDKLNTTSSSSTKLDHKEGRDEKVSIVKTQEHVQGPIELKSTSAANINIKPEHKDAIEKERITRDLKDNQKSKHNDNEKVSLSTEVSTGVEIKKGIEKLGQKAVTIENKSLISTIKDDHVERNKDLKETPAKFAHNIESTTKSGINPKMSENPTQDAINANIENTDSEKFPREIKKTDLEGPTTPTNKLLSIASNKDKVQEPKQLEKTITPPQ